MNKKQKAAYAEALRMIESVKQRGNLGTYLDLISPDLTEVPPEIGQLSALRKLSISNSQLATLPSEIGQLTALTQLSLSDNNLATLPSEIGQLTALTRLSLSNNRLTTLPSAIGKLCALRTLFINDNELTALPDELLGLRYLQALFLHGNPGLDLPAEVLGPRWEEVERRKAKPASPKLILAYYLRMISENGKRPLNECKLILVGRGTVGKTTLVHRLVHKKFVKKTKTKGIHVSDWLVPGPAGPITAHVWDFGGQEIMHGTHQFFLTERSLYMLVLAGREDREDEDAEYWLKMISAFGGDSPVVVVLNKYEEHGFELNEEMLMEKYPRIEGFHRTDCLSGMGIDQLRKVVSAAIAATESVRVSFPAEWFAVKQRLTNMPESYMTYDRYRELCAELGERQRKDQDDLAHFLHVLGIALNYRDDPRLRDTSVLNPRWVTDGIYTVINDDSIRQKNGVVRRTDLGRVLPKDQYPRKMHEFLLRLMMKFELCFPLDDEERQYLIPELLTKRQPALGEEFAPDDCLCWDYAYGTLLPEGLLPRFIVRAYTLIADNLRWRTGVVLQWKGARALVKADEAERRVLIRVHGDTLDAPRQLLSLIRAHFDAIHANFKKLDPVAEVRILMSDKAFFVRWDELLAAAAHSETRLTQYRGRLRITITVWSHLETFCHRTQLDQEVDAFGVYSLRRELR